MPAVVDAFVFNDELDMLRFRRAETRGAVDAVVLAEAPVAFSGAPKPLAFAAVAHEFPDVHHVVVRDMPGGPDAWAREIHQRNALMRGLRALDLRDDDVVVVSDVDEIPDPRVLRGFRAHGLEDLVRLEQDMYYYDITTRAGTWALAFAAPWRVLKAAAADTHSLEDLRLRGHRGQGPVLRRAGWHLSYFMDPPGIARKLAQFSHHRDLDTPERTDHDRIRDHVRRRTSLVCGRQLEHVPLHRNTYLPARLDALPARPDAPDAEKMCAET